jgi:hypothetical protein
MESVWHLVDPLKSFLKRIAHSRYIILRNGVLRAINAKTQFALRRRQQGILFPLTSVLRANQKSCDIRAHPYRDSDANNTKQPSP